MTEHRSRVDWWLGLVILAIPVGSAFLDDLAARVTHLVRDADRLVSR